MKFPDGASVYAWFAPTHWERFAGPIDGRVAVRPCPTLQDVATLYHDADLPRAIVRNAISGLASLSSASFNVSQQAVELAVGQFMGRYSRPRRAHLLRHLRRLRLPDRHVAGTDEGGVTAGSSFTLSKKHK